ncbi:MAG: 50S ribosomal protein L21 [Rhodobiaceae bacterium]|nr:50S ribosomal protein L21 [Rhodobiaceae bacterium]|tara:strand:+ start:299 stop:793 length:495 start_codon:yes stop_codon:yes gene_type:complete
MYAVIKTGGKQYKVSKDDVISVEKLPEDAGKKIKLNEVLIISDKGKPIVGDPLIKGANVEAEIMDHSRAAKITIFKKKRRHNYRRKKGHKQNITNLKILSINSSQGKTKAADTEEKKPAAKKAAPKKVTPKKAATKSKKTEDKPKKSDKKAKSEPKKTNKGSKE